MLQPKSTLLGEACRDDAVGCQGEPHHMDIWSRKCHTPFFINFKGGHNLGGIKGDKEMKDTTCLVMLGVLTSMKMGDNVEYDFMMSKMV